MSHKSSSSPLSYAPLFREDFSLSCLSWNEFLLFVQPRGGKLKRRWNQCDTGQHGERDDGTRKSEHSGRFSFSPAWSRLVRGYSLITWTENTAHKVISANRKVSSTRRDGRQLPFKNSLNSKNKKPHHLFALTCWTGSRWLKGHSVETRVEIAKSRKTGRESDLFWEHEVIVSAGVEGGSELPGCFNEPVCHSAAVDWRHWQEREQQEDDAVSTTPSGRLWGFVFPRQGSRASRPSLVSLRFRDVLYVAGWMSGPCHDHPPLCRYASCKRLVCATDLSYCLEMI